VDTRFNKEREDIEREKKKPWRHIEVLITTSPVSLERSYWDELNDTKKGHQQWSDCAIRAIQRCQSSVFSLFSFYWILYSIILQFKRVAYNQSC